VVAPLYFPRAVVKIEKNFSGFKKRASGEIVGEELLHYYDHNSTLSYNKFYVNKKFVR
jgi:hypothetical protein